MSKAVELDDYIRATGKEDLIDPEWKCSSWAHPKAPKPRGKSMGRFYGRRYDLDDRRIVTRPDILERQINMTTDEIYKRYISEGAGRIALVGVAGRTNRAVGPIADELSGIAKVEAIATQEEDGHLSLTSEGIVRLGFFVPEVAIVLEGVGTTGHKAAEAALAVQSRGIDNVKALITIQRTERLTELERAGIDYAAMHNVSREFKVYNYTNHHDYTARRMLAK